MLKSSIVLVNQALDKWARLDTNLKHNSNYMLNPHQNSAEKHHVRIKELEAKTQ